MKAVLVTTLHRGVFFGFVDPDKVTEKTLVLERCKCCIYWSASVRGFLGLAATGPDCNCKIGAEAPKVIVHDVTSVTDVSEKAVEAWSLM